MRRTGNDGWDFGQAYGVHFIARDLILFKRPLISKLGGLFLACFGAFGCVGMGLSLMDPAPSLEFRLFGALGFALNLAFVIYGLRLLGPHEMTIDLARGIYGARTGFFGLETVHGDVSEIEGFVMVGTKVRNHKIYQLFLVWRDPNRPSFPLVTIRYFKHSASLVLQEVALRTGLPVEDET